MIAAVRRPAAAEASSAGHATPRRAPGGYPVGDGPIGQPPEAEQHLRAGQVRQHQGPGDDLHLDEPGRGEQAAQRPAGRRTADPLHRHRGEGRLDLGVAAVNHQGAPVGLGGQHDPARPHDPRHLPHHRRGVRHVLQHALAPAPVSDPVVERQRAASATWNSRPGGALAERRRASATIEALSPRRSRGPRGRRAARAPGRRRPGRSRRLRARRRAPPPGGRTSASSSGRPRPRCPRRRDSSRARRDPRRPRGRTCRSPAGVPGGNTTGAAPRRPGSGARRRSPAGRPARYMAAPCAGAGSARSSRRSTVSVRTIETTANAAATQKAAEKPSTSACGCETPSASALRGGRGDGGQDRDARGRRRSAGSC